MSNYSQMSTKKLNKLMADANTPEEIKLEVQKVLDERASVAETAMSQGPVAETQVAEAPVAETQVAGVPETAEAPVAKKAKMTDEELDELVAKLRATVVNHKCEVVPFNTAEWVTGVIVSVIPEKRSSKAMLAIKTDDGRRIVKLPDSPLLKILDEVVEVPKKVRSNKKLVLDENGNPIPGQTKEWSEQEIEAAIQEVIENVGKMVSFPEAGRYGEVEEGAETLTGRIVSLVPNKRNFNILYRIEVPAENNTVRIVHKTAGNALLQISDSLDEDGKKLNDAYKERRYNKEVKAALTPKEVFEAAEASFNKAKETFEKAEANFKRRQEAYEVAKAAYEDSLNAPEANEAPEATEANDLM